MPALHRTIVPRIRKSLEVHGVLGTLRLSLTAPVRFIHEYQAARRSYRPAGPDAFDLAHQVETSQRVHQSDLATDSPNWVYGVGYWPTPVALVREVLSSLPVQHEQFTFIDLGSGKGRVLLLASDYPFKRIIGVEYAPELQQVACENIRRYESANQKCRVIQVVCQDMTEFALPEGPLVIFLYNPASEPVMRIVVKNIISSLRDCPRPALVVYVTPSYDVFRRALPGSVSFQNVKATDKYEIYSSAV
jgi:Histone methylation protein DOT1